MHWIAYKSWLHFPLSSPLHFFKLEQCLLILAEEADTLEVFIWRWRINNSFCFFSAGTHMLGMQRFGKTHFMLIVYLIRNSNCLVRIINLWKSNRSIVYPHVMLFVYAYEIFIPWRGSLATTTSLWYDFIWSQVSWHCHHQLPRHETWNNVKGARQQMQNNMESSCNKRETDSWVSLCVLWHLFPVEVWYFNISQNGQKIPWKE